MSNLLSRVVRSFAPARRPETRAARYTGGSLSNPPSWLERLLLGNKDADVAGVSIDETSALSISTVFACIRAISEDVGKLPLVLYREKDGEGKERLKKHPLYRLLRHEPNPEMSAFDFRSCITAHALSWGNGYVEIERDGTGRPRALWPIIPPNVSIRRSTVSGEIVYDVIENGRVRTIFADDMIHIRGLGFDGLVGYSVVWLARKSLGLSAAAENFGASFFGNSSMPKGVLEHPATLGEPAQKNLRDSWEAVHKGSSNYGRVAILEEGMKFHAITIPPEDAQFLETRQFQVPEVCRWFRMPPHKVADLTRATFSNIEHSSIEYVGDTLLPWLVRWEQEIRRKLFMGSEGDLFVEHLTAALLRGDIKSRYEAYAIGRQWGWLSPDDVRGLENMNQIESDGGDTYLVPSNMLDAAKFANMPEVDPNAAPGSATPAEDPEDDPKTVEKPTREAFRDLVHRTLSKVRRSEADKIVRNAKRDSVVDWVATFYSERRDAMTEILQPIASAFVASECPAGFDFASEARSIAEDLAGAHLAYLSSVFADGWQKDADRRSIEWLTHMTEEVDSIVGRMASIVEQRHKENWK